MVAPHRLKFLYFIGLLALCTMIALSWLYEDALLEADNHLLRTQAELISTKFKNELSNSNFRQVADAFGSELPNFSFEVVARDGTSVFRSRSVHSMDRCAKSSLVGGKFFIEVCRVSGPWETLLEQIQRRAKIFILIAGLLLLGAIFYFIQTIRRSILSSVTAISKALDNSPVDRSAPLDALLAHLAGQKERIKEFENIVATNARLAAIGAITAQFQHDVSNPLGLISLALNANEPDEEFSEGARDAVVRIKAMVADMGRYSKSLKVNIVDVELEEVAQVAADEIGARQPNFSIEIECPAILLAKADPLALIRILTNLFKNSYEAGSPNVRLSAKLDSSMQKVELQISDWGSGIPPELREKLLKPFVTFGKKEGTGLGLWHGAQVVSAMNGSLVLQSPGVNGAATTVTITLPRT